MSWTLPRWVDCVRPTTPPPRTHATGNNNIQEPSHTTQHTKRRTASLSFLNFSRRCRCRRGQVRQWGVWGERADAEREENCIGKMMASLVLAGRVGGSVSEDSEGPHLLACMRCCASQHYDPHASHHYSHHRNEEGCRAGPGRCLRCHGGEA